MRSNVMVPLFKPYLIFLLFLIIFNSCNPFYITRAAYEEFKILSKRQDISEILSERTLPEKELEKLAIIPEVKQYASLIGLKPKNTFTKYAKMPDKPLVWVIAASKPDAFQLYTWWFPIVGRVPYKGYFSKDDATSLARNLREDGYETWVRGAMTFSTLGWFNDPVFSSLLKKDDFQIVETVIHETVHTSFWLPNFVTVNESMAHFIGMQEAVNFFQAKLLQCNNCPDKTTLKQNFKIARLHLNQELIIGEVITELYQKLDALYKSKQTKSEKIRHRHKIFNEEIEPLRAKFPKLTAFKTINNAEIIQYKLYLTHLRDFKHLYQKYNGSLPKFFKEIEQLSEKAKKTKNPEKEFFNLLSKQI